VFIYFEKLKLNFPYRVSHLTHEVKYTFMLQY